MSFLVNIQQQQSEEMSVGTLPLPHFPFQLNLLFLSNPLLILCNFPPSTGSNPDCLWEAHPLLSQLHRHTIIEVLPTRPLTQIWAIGPPVT